MDVVPTKDLTELVVAWLDTSDFEYAVLRHNMIEISISDDELQMQLVVVDREWHQPNVIELRYLKIITSDLSMDRERQRQVLEALTLRCCGKVMVYDSGEQANLAYFIEWLVADTHEPFNFWDVVKFGMQNVRDYVIPVVSKAASSDAQVDAIVSAIVSE